MSGRQEILKCNICLEMMKDEKMLPSCGHMFCQECLESYVGHKREIKCPMCREKCTVPEGGVKAFPKNIYLNQFLDQLCGSCSKYPRSERCPHCEEMICAKCKDTHMAELRQELKVIVNDIEILNETSIIKDSKKEKKILADKQKNLEKDISKTAEDIIKLVRNQEKKLKSQLKLSVGEEMKVIDAKGKTYHEGISNLKEFTKKYDVKNHSDEKMEEMKTKWTTRYNIIQQSLNSDVTVRDMDLTCSVDVSEIEKTISDSWKLLNSNGTELNLNVARLSVSSSGSNLVSESKLPSVTKLVPFFVFGGEGTTTGKLKSPFGIAVTPTNNILVSDTHNHRIQKFDPSGKPMGSFGSSGASNGQLKSPIGIMSLPKGDYIVADTENHRIVIFDSQGRFLRTFGKEGNGVNDFNQPWGLAIDSTNQNIHITDCGNNRIQVISIYGRYIRTIGRGELKSPTGIAIDEKDNIFVADCDNHRIVNYSKHGSMNMSFGLQGSKQGQMSSPCDVVLDLQGNLVVAEWGNHRIQVFTKEGRSLRVFGQRGSSHGEFKEPRAVAVSPDGNIIVCDCGNNRIQMF